MPESSNGTCNELDSMANEDWGKHSNKINELGRKVCLHNMSSKCKNEMVINQKYAKRNKTG